MITIRDKLKNFGIIVGHVVCAAIVLMCILKSDELLKEQVATVVTPDPETAMNTPVPTVASTPVPTMPLDGLTPNPTQTPQETLMPTLTNTPILTNTPTPTNTQIPTNTPVPTNTPIPTNTQTPTPTEEELRNVVKQQVLNNIESGTYAELDNARSSWWFIRKLNQIPSGSGESFEIEKYWGYYRNKYVENEDKVIYITIDCGYGSANTPVMLDIFKKHNIKVTFFVTKFFIDANPEYVLRMIEEGHMVGNHSVTHADLTELTDQEVYDEIIGCEEAFYELTGQQIDMYFRLPEGGYSERVMQIIKDLGYETMFWSIAYNDYDKNNQPTVEWILDHFETYHHNGALTLMHNDSDGNKNAMDQVLTFLEEEGYRFGTLDEFGVPESEETTENLQ